MSRSKRASKAPWIALVLLAGGVVGLYFMFFSGDPDLAVGEPGATGSSDIAATAHAPAPTAGQTPPVVSPVAQRPPARPMTDGSVRPRAGTPEQRPAQPDLSAYTKPDERPLAGPAKDQFELGIQKLDEGDLVTGRALLSELLFRDGALPRHEAEAVRERLTFENRTLVFSKKKIPNDTITTTHTVQSGEYLGPIANTYRTPYQFIERMNGIKATGLQAGQVIKVLRGPVHARVDKSDYRMDLYVEDPDGLKIYLQSFTIGLGEFDSTPIGLWRIKPGSKVGPENGGPSWRNPRTGESFDRNDPNIPIGEYWMALEGLDENTKGKNGYGIHATNDQDSIGRQESMGCIRMRDEDVDVVFYTLFEGLSRVEIVP